MIDWDGDGDLDLVVGDAAGNLHYFERRSADSVVELIGYNINPFYGIDVDDYASPAVADWDGDGDLDLVVGDGVGNLHYFERVDDKQLQWRGGAGVNPFHAIQANAGFAYPVLCDWNQDGRVDLLLGAGDDYLMFYERLSDGSLWYPIPVGGTENYSRHLKPAVSDWDGDGDLDLVIGNEFERLQYFERVSAEMVQEHIVHPFQTVEILFRGNPAIGDWDGDGDLDLAVGDAAGLVSLFSLLPNGEFEEDTGDGSTSPVSDIDVGDFSAPFAVDWDMDGDVDLVVGDSGGNLHFFERNASAGTLVQRFGEGSNPFHGIRVEFYARPVAIDWDGDHDFDLIVGDLAGNVHYFERQPTGTLVQLVGQDDNPLSCVNVSRAAAPAIADWDGDGDLDVIVGSSLGQLHYFEHLSTGALVQRIGEGSNPFHEVTDYSQSASTPVVVDWDKDGDLDVIVGDRDGKLYYFERLAGDLVARRIGQGANPFYGVDVGEYSAPAAVDWDGDGDIELLVGEIHGSLSFAKQKIIGQMVQVIGPGENPFDGIAVPGPCAPTIVDWDMDGDPDLVIADAYGNLLYFERLAVDIVEQRMGEGDNPFFNISRVYFAAPTFGDWDGDGDPDLIIGDGEGNMHYYEQQPTGVLVQRIGEGQNPFHNIHVGYSGHASPTSGDWDKDGDLDLVVGDDRGRLHYFERTATGELEQRIGEGSNPFHFVTISAGFAGPTLVDFDHDGDLDVVVGDNSGNLFHFDRVSHHTVEMVTEHSRNIDVGVLAKPALADWDGDGDLDLLVGNADGRVLFYLQQFCEQPMQCGFRGVCHPLNGQCTCQNGYIGSDCSSCAHGFFTTMLGFPRHCTPCPGSREGSSPCSLRGLCSDDAAAKASDSSIVAIGNGTCLCSEEGIFTGADCSVGECLAGTAEYRSSDGSPNTCVNCSAGTYSDPPNGMTSCEACPAGRASQLGEGTGECRLCEAGRFAAGLGSPQCEPCAPGQFSSAGSSACGPCPANTRPNRERSDCVSCPFGTGALEGSDECAFDWMFTVLAACILFQHYGFYTVARHFRRKTRILDISQLGDKVAITTFGRHFLCRSRNIAVIVADTKHFFIDQQRHFLARCLDSYRLELRSLDGEPIEDQVDASTGWLMPVFPNDVLYVVGAMKIPSIIIAAGCGLVPWFVLIGLNAYEYSRHHMIVAALPACMVATVLLDVVLVVAVRRRYFAHRTPLQQRVVDYQTELVRRTVALASCHYIAEDQNEHVSRASGPLICERGAGRALTAEQLTELLHKFSDILRGRTAYYLDANITRPLTEPYQCSFAELAKPCQASYFISHFWGTPFQHFVGAVQSHSSHCIAGASYWICFLSINQWDIAEELGNGDWRRSSFFKVLQSGYCQATVMVLDEMAMPLTRAWCLFEVLQTYQLVEQGKFDNFEGLVYATRNGVLGLGGESACFDVTIALADRLSTLNLADATASSKSDEEMIKQHVEECGGAECMNKFVRTNMKRTLMEVQDQFDASVKQLEQGLDTGPGSRSSPTLSKTVNEVAEHDLTLSFRNTMSMHLAVRDPTDTGLASASVVVVRDTTDAGTAPEDGPTANLRNTMSTSLAVLRDPADAGPARVDGAIRTVLAKSEAAPAVDIAVKTLDVLLDVRPEPKLRL